MPMVSLGGKASTNQHNERLNQMNKTIDTEVVPEQQAMVVRQETAVAPTTLFGSNEPVAVVQKASQVASALKDVVKTQGLISVISGKEYPRCEAWTLLGTMLGVFPVLQWTRQLENGWEARVEAKTRDGAIVGAAEAQCLRKEKNWSNRDDFALRSMAQTRATAKALRMPLGFVMTLAGYEATPAEEMISDHTHTELKQSKQTKVSTPTKSTEDNRDLVLEFRKLIGRMEPEVLRFIRSEPTKSGRNLLMPNEGLEDLEPADLRKMINHWDDMYPRIEAWLSEHPATPEETPDDPNADDAPWRAYPVPWGKQAGVPLAELDKKYLYGLWANFEVEEEYNGKPKKPETIEKEQEFRNMLDQAGEHYEFTKKD